MIVELHGEIDTQRADHVRDRLLSAGVGKTSIVVDLGAVTFIDSTGLGALVAADMAVKLVLRDPSPAVQRAMDVTGLTEHFSWQRTARFDR